MGSKKTYYYEACFNGYEDEFDFSAGQFAYPLKTEIPPEDMTREVAEKVLFGQIIGKDYVIDETMGKAFGTCTAIIELSEKEAKSRGLGFFSKRVKTPYGIAYRYPHEPCEPFIWFQEMVSDKEGQTLAFFCNIIEDYRHKRMVAEKFGIPDADAIRLVSLKLKISCNAAISLEAVAFYSWDDECVKIPQKSINLPRFAEALRKSGTEEAKNALAALLEKTAL